LVDFCSRINFNSEFEIEASRTRLKKSDFTFIAFVLHHLFWILRGMFAVLKYWGRMSMIIFLGGEFTVRTSVLTKDVTNCCQLKSFGIAKALSDLVIHDFIPFEMHFD